MAHPIRVWYDELDGLDMFSIQLERCLSQDEIDSSQRIRNYLDRSRYLASHALLRRRLSVVVGTAPTEIVISRTALGKPLLRHDSCCHFSLSRSGPKGLMGIARGTEVGVDIQEVCEDFAWEPVADRLLPREDRERIYSLPGGERIRAFYQAWVCAEAILKASGMGLGGFEQMAASYPTIDHAWSRLRREYTCREISVGDGYAAAIAAKGDHWVLDIVS